MTVIAMTREMGTLGKDVATGLAEELGIEIIHHELIEHHLAERLDVGESAVHRFLEGQASLWERWHIDSSRMSRYTADEVLQLAARGNVLIRGWGAAQLLRDISHVMCVRICAPMSKRVAVMMERLGISDDQAIRREIERNDSAHSRTVLRQFDGDWRDAENYDVVLNTGFLPVKTCVAQLKAIALSGAYEESEQSRRLLVDKSIEAEVRRVLDAYAADSNFGSGLNVGVTDGAVTLSGVVNGPRDLAGTIEKVQNLKGVTAVHNNVLSLPAGTEV